MPSIESQNRFQDTTLWTPSGVDRNGELTVNSPVNIKTRWDASLTASINETGTPTASNGTVVVDIDVEEGSIMRLGLIADLPNPVTTGLYEVVSFNKVPDIKGRKFHRTVTLKRYKGQLPTVV